MHLFKIVAASVRILIADCKYFFLLHCFTVVFYCVYVYSVDVVEVAPPGAAEDHRELLGHANRISSFLLRLSARLVSQTVVKQLFYNALPLNALPVHLLRQVFV